MNRATSILVIALAAPAKVYACSFALGYQPVPWFMGEETVSDNSGSPPLVHIQSLSRGYNDGQIGSCSDAGVLRIELEDAEVERGAFLFEVVDGEFPDAVLPSEPVRPLDLPNGTLGFTFVWLDLPWGQAAPSPIDVTLAITQFDSLGVRSQPAFLRILDSGESIPDSFVFGLAVWVLWAVFLLFASVAVLRYLGHRLRSG